MNIHDLWVLRYKQSVPNIYMYTSMLKCKVTYIMILALLWDFRMQKTPTLTLPVLHLNCWLIYLQKI